MSEDGHVLAEDVCYKTVINVTLVGILCSVEF